MRIKGETRQTTAVKSAGKSKTDFEKHAVNFTVVKLQCGTNRNVCTRVELSADQWYSECERYDVFSKASVKVKLPVFFSGAKEYVLRCTESRTDFHSILSHLLFTSFSM
jgi:hypothetical protein